MSAIPKRPQPHLTLVDARASYEQLSDRELILCCQNRDKAAYEVLVKRYQRTVYGSLYQLAPDWHDTSDLAQEVFIRIWRSIGSLRNPHAFRSWLNQLITNLFYDELRKRPKNATVSIDESFKSDEGDENNCTRDIADHSSMPDEMTQRRELSDAIHRAIDKLPEQFRTVIVLRELEGLTYDEISVLTNTEIGTVKSRIARARMKIQEMLSPYVSAA